MTTAAAAVRAIPTGEISGCSRLKRRDEPRRELLDALRQTLEQFVGLAGGRCCRHRVPPPVGSMAAGRPVPKPLSRGGPQAGASTHERAAQIP